jgi:hypothetical protein
MPAFLQKVTKRTKPANAGSSLSSFPSVEIRDRLTPPPSVTLRLVRADTGSCREWSNQTVDELWKSLVHRVYKTDADPLAKPSQPLTAPAAMLSSSS